MTATQRIVEAQGISPEHAVIGGWAAAYAHGVDLLDGLDDHTMRPLPVPVFLPPRLHRPTVTGARYLQQELDEEDVRVVGGMRVTATIRTALDLARSAHDVTEAVVALDAMLAAKVVTQSQLADRLLSIRGRRGCRQAAEAMRLARTGVRSTWETQLRLCYVLEVRRAGLIVVRSDKKDLTKFRPRLVGRLAAARSDGLQRDRRRDGWTSQEPENWIGLPA